MRSGRSPRALARTLVLSAIVIVAVRYALYFDGRFEAASFWSVARGDGIFYGSALALVIADRTSLIARTLRFSAVGVFGAVMLLGITVGCRPGVSATWCGTPAASVGATILIGHLVMNRDGLLAMLLALRPLPAIGRMSYGLYLFHWPVTVWMYQWTNPTSGAAAVTMFAVTFAIAIASYHLLERPFMRLYGRITAPRAEVIELQKKTKPADHRRLVAAG